MTIELTEKIVGSLRVGGTNTVGENAGKPRTRQDFMDALVPGFGVRVTDKGQRTYIVAARFPGSPSYTRREIDSVGTISLKDARQAAREWLLLIRDGKDPANVRAEKAAAEAAKKRDEERRNGHTVTAVAADFLDDPVIKRQRKLREVTRHVGQLTQLWGSRPIHSITRSEALALIKAKARSAPAEARNLRNDASQLFAWARDQDYGLEVNVFADIKPGRVIGEKVARDRALSTDEIRRLWAEVSKLHYPYKEAYQLLILSGLRLRECTAAKWGEFDFDAEVWTVPPHRMKGKTGKAKPFKVPLTGRMISILRSIKRFSGDYVFTTDGGRTHVVLGSKIKNRLDAALQFGEPFVNHDLRRTVATRLTDDLGIKETVADAILAHRKKGIEAVYNRAEYVEQRRAALEKWGDHVDPFGNVMPLRARA